MDLMSKAKRVVIKVGTSTLTHKTGLLNIRRIENLVKVMADIKNSGREIVLVTSGSVGVGVGKIGLSNKPEDTPTKQACAALGQCELMYVYDKHFSVYNHSVAQILLTRDIIDDEQRKSNVRNTFDRLLSLGVVPVVNENDTVSVEEIEFGDNDTLSAIVATLVEADALIILTDIDGLYNKDPRRYDDAEIIHTVTEITDCIRASAGEKGSTLGTGGMITKVEAAQIALNAGITTIVANGKNPKLLYDIFEDKTVGTRFESKQGK